MPAALSPLELEELRVRLEAREQYQAASTEEKKRIQYRASLEADFSSFVRAAWHVLRPGLELKWSWHYDLIGEYLTLVYERKERRLVINCPPRTLKSILVTVMFPVWVWGKQPAHNFTTASYSGDLSTEHSVWRRNIIESNWFRNLWGDKVWLAEDQNQKTKFKNNHQAQMIATSVGGTATGLGGDTLILDDGLKPEEAPSDTIRTAAHAWFDGTWTTRLNDPATGAMLVVEQRTHELDISGTVIAGGGWTHLCFPLEAETDEEWKFPVSGRVVVRRTGEILQPDRFPPAAVAALKSKRLVWAGQYQQHPSPLEGNMIKRNEVRYYGGRDPVTGEVDPELPDQFDLIIISADCAFKDLKTSDYVAVGAIGAKGPKRFILTVALKHLDQPATEAEIKRQRKTYGAHTVLVEDKANGPAVIKKLRQEIPGVVEINPEGGKIARMFAICGEWQAGNWYVDRNAAWTEPFVSSITKFPNAAYDDDVDMMTQAGIWLQRGNRILGLVEFLKQEDEELKKRRPAEKADNAGENLIEAVKDSEAVKKTASESPVQKSVPTEEIIKVDLPGNVLRCRACGSVLMQRVPGGRRCGACGTQVMQNNLLAQPIPGLVRK